MKAETPSRPDTRPRPFRLVGGRPQTGCAHHARRVRRAPPSSARSERTGLNGPLLRGYSVAFRAPLAGAPRLFQDRMRSSSLTQAPRNSPKRYNPKPSTGSRHERLRSRFFLPAFSLLRVTSRSLLRNFSCRPFEVPNLFPRRRACGPASSQPAGNRYAWRTAALHSAPRCRQDRPQQPAAPVSVNGESSSLRRKAPGYARASRPAGRSSRQSRSRTT